MPIRRQRRNNFRTRQNNYKPDSVISYLHFSMPACFVPREYALKRDGRRLQQVGLPRFTRISFILRCEEVRSSLWLSHPVSSGIVLTFFRTWDTSFVC
jgi:hypothetical protein